MSQYGIHVPEGIPATTIDGVVDAAEKMKDEKNEVIIHVSLSSFPVDIFLLQCGAQLLQVVLKSQILAGGRGLGTFKSGLKGGVHVCKTSEIKGLAEKMLGQILVTKQTGEAGACCCLNTQSCQSARAG
jgi:succinyl-CoA synthetase beta subunit